jgi:hypothetical protein
MVINTGTPSTVALIQCWITADIAPAKNRVRITQISGGINSLVIRPKEAHIIWYGHSTLVIRLYLLVYRGLTDSPNDFQRNTTYREPKLEGWS